MVLTRRSLLLLLPAASVIDRATAQSLIADALNDFQRYVSAASLIVVRLSTALEATSFSGATPQQQSELRDNLDRLDGSLSGNLEAQGSFIGRLDFYIDKAKDASVTPHARADFWKKAVVTGARSVQDAVRGAADLINGFAALDQALSADERMALNDTLRARLGVLERIAAAPPPTAPDELLLLESTVTHYRMLIGNLRSLRMAVGAARGRLNALRS